MHQSYHIDQPPHDNSTMASNFDFSHFNTLICTARSPGSQPQLCEGQVFRTDGAGTLLREALIGRLGVCLGAFLLNCLVAAIALVMSNEAPPQPDEM